MRDINLSQEELDQIRDTDAFRARLLTEFKYLRRDVDDVKAAITTQQKTCGKQIKECTKSWRSDMLWFLGVPTMCIALIAGALTLFNSVNKQGVNHDTKTTANRSGEPRQAA